MSHIMCYLWKINWFIKNNKFEKSYFWIEVIKNTFDFITNTKEKTEKEKNKRIIINQCLENIKKKKMK